MKILLQTDKPILAIGLREALRETEGQHSLSVCQTVPELLARLDLDPPDVVLLDQARGVELAALGEIKHALSRFRTALWVEDIPLEFAFQAIQIGVRGIIQKSLPAHATVELLQNLADGRMCVEKEVTEQFLAARRINVTQREGQIIALLTRGLKNKEIAATLHLTEGTVKVYLSNLMAKLGVKDRYEMALWGLKNLGFGKAPDKLCGLRTVVIPSST